MEYWATTELDEYFVDEEGQCGLGRGTTIKATLVCDCYPEESKAELKEVLFSRIFTSTGSPIYSLFGYNAVQLGADEWRALHDFVCHKAQESWLELEPKALAADPVEFFSQEDENEY